MLTIEQIKANFSSHLFERNSKGVLVEYLQYELLDSIYKFEESRQLSFIGGTAIRIIHDSNRFSEDLDFDNFGLSYGGFERLLNKVVTDMENKGFLIEFRLIESGAYHCYVKFPKILQDTGISSHSKEKILVRIDTEHKDKTYKPIIHILNKFMVYRKIQIAPVDILLAQKLITILQRKREKGRDLYDTSFLYGLSQPNVEYIQLTTKMSFELFRSALLARVESFDLSLLAKDVDPFLFSSADVDRILTFDSFVRQAMKIS